MIFDLFFFKILTAILFLGALSGPLGSLILWQRMSLVGDVLAHSAILGIVIAEFSSFPLLLVYFLFSILLGFIIQKVNLKKHKTEYVLLTFSYGFLALGTLFASQMSLGPLQFQSILFGDLLSMTTQDMFWIFGLGFLMIIHLIVLWKPFVLISFHEELAIVEGIPVGLLKMVLSIILALFIALTVKVAGALLIMGLLIISPLTASRFSSTPEDMILKSSMIGIFAVGGGVLSSFYYDLPLGSAVVGINFGLFLLTLMLKKSRA